MQNIVANMYEKFHNDRLRNDRALGNGKSDNNNKKKSAWRPVPGLKRRNVLSYYGLTESRMRLIKLTAE